MEDGELVLEHEPVVSLVGRNEYESWNALAPDSRERGDRSEADGFLPDLLSNASGFEGESGGNERAASTERPYGASRGCGSHATSTVGYRLEDTGMGTDSPVER